MLIPFTPFTPSILLLLNQFDSIMPPFGESQLVFLKSSSFLKPDNKDNHDVDDSITGASTSSLETVAGETTSKQIGVSSSSSSSLPIHVTVTPFVLLSLSASDEEKYRVEIRSCDHTKVFKSSLSGVVGEAKIEIHITPLSSLSSFSSKKKKKVGYYDKQKKKSDDVSRSNISDVRAFQQLSATRFQTTISDVFTSSTYGKESLTVLIKMRTYHNVCENPTAMDIQVVLEPPSPPSSN